MPAKVDADDRRRRLVLAAAELIADEGINALTNAKNREAAFRQHDHGHALLPEQTRARPGHLPDDGLAITGAGGTGDARKRRPTGFVSARAAAPR